MATFIARVTLKDFLGQTKNITLINCNTFEDLILTFLIAAIKLNVSDDELETLKNEMAEALANDNRVEVMETKYFYQLTNCDSIHAEFDVI